MGHTKSEMIVHDLRSFNPNTKISDPNHRKEADLVEQVAGHVKSGKLQAVMQIETEFESWGHVTIEYSEKGKFYGAPIKRVNAPIEYSRILMGAGFSAKELQLQFLGSIRHKRFLELQKITGGFQGKGKYCQKQLVDAFHIWCAEHNHCDYFLTLDYKLIKMVESHYLKPIKPTLVRPSQLLAQLAK